MTLPKIYLPATWVGTTRADENGLGLILMVDGQNLRLALSLKEAVSIHETVKGQVEAHAQRIADQSPKSAETPSEAGSIPEVGQKQ